MTCDSIGLFSKIIASWRLAGTRSPLEREAEIQISGRSNRTQCCQRLATAAVFFQKELCCPGAMMWRWALRTRYTLWRNTANVIKDLIKVLAA